MNEAEFYQLAKRNLPHWTWDRVESLINSGQPDTTICHGFVKRRLELKIVRSGKIWFEPSQISWATRMKNANVWGDYVLAWDIHVYLINYYYIPQLAKSNKYRKKYEVSLNDISILYKGWEKINGILREAPLTWDMPGRK